ncbi:MAG: phenylacetate--CoA ligase [Deltaproteobacteria bacterium]|nr:MAG: phenylacetate--CoA ligase [Deltaproteobacteria bacterium]
MAAAFDYLFEASPFYRRRFEEAGLAPGSIRSLDDLRRVPVTRKLDWIPDIEAHPPWGTFSPLTEERWRDHPWMIFSTSGTTRRPRLFRHTTHDRDLWAWMNARALWSYGVRPGEIALNCFYYGASVAAWGLHEGLVRLGCPVVPGGAMPPERRAAVIPYLRPATILGTPSGLLTLGRRVQEQGDDPAALGVRTLVCAGEPGAAVGPTKRRLEALWGASVHDDFGCTEIAMAPLGYTCRAEAGKTDGEVGVHLMEDAVIVEVLDPITLEPVPVGQRGTLVVSNLYSEAAPFLRFDMGDWIQLRDDPCACGRTHARAVGGLLGRNDHCLKIKGLQFFPSTFEDAIRSIDGLGDEYRVEVRAGAAPGREDLEIIVERGPDVALTEHCVASRLRGLIGITVAVTLVEPGRLPRSDGKGVRFVDRRAEAGR